MSVIWNLDDDSVSFDVKDSVMADTLLREFCDNGSAQLIGGVFYVSYEEISKLEEYDRITLELPAVYPYTLRVDADGDLHEADFRFKYSFCRHFHGETFICKRNGCFISRAGEREQWLLSFERMRICDEIDNFSSQCSNQPSNLGAALLCLKKIQDLARDNAAELSPILADTRVETPEIIDIDIRAEEDAIYVAPVLKDIDVSQEKFAERVDKWRSPRSVYTEDAPDGKVKRVVFSPDKTEALSQIKKHKALRGEDKDSFLKNPQEFFDPDHVNLDNFGERVVGIGCYKPKYVPFVSAGKSDWFAEGVVIEVSPVERRQIIIDSEEKLKKLGEAIDEAARNQTGAVKLSLPGNEENGEAPTIAELPLEVAASLYERAAKRLSVRGRMPQEKQVVIIHDNIDNVGYGGQGAGQEKGRGTEEFIHKFETPPNMREGVNLFEHQMEGIAWLQELSRAGKGSEIGALLADDMGLGKTLQVLAFLEWHRVKTQNDTKPYLIVAPVALLENWEREYKNFFPQGEMLVKQLYSDEAKTFVPEDACTGDIFLTTYETLRKRQLVLCQVDWAVVVADEAQKIKAPGILTTTAVKALKAEMRIAMTGTPVENGLVDLWSIVDFAVPGHLGSVKAFAKKYHKGYESKEKIIAVGEELRGKLGIFFKRRLKDDILRDLPPKTIFQRKRNMPDVQLRTYEAALRDIADEKLALSGDSNMQAFALKTLSKLRDISNHPFLTTMEEQQLYSAGIDEFIRSSAKLSMTVEVIKEIEARGEKLILFAIHRPVQRFLQRVASHVLGVPLRDVPIINGETPASERAAAAGAETRQRAIDRFQSNKGCGAIVISPLAAGFGLNITGANNVIHYERHWNPAKENQATDRTHRIGQEKTVSVYYPIATAPDFLTFDEVLNERLEYKSGLAEGVLFPTGRVEVTPLEMLSSLENG